MRSVALVIRITSRKLLQHFFPCGQGFGRINQRFLIRHLDPKNMVRGRPQYEPAHDAHLGFDVLGVVLAIDVASGSLVF